MNMMSFKNLLIDANLKNKIKYLKWKEEIISSGIEFSKDELKYNKMI